MAGSFLIARPIGVVHAGSCTTVTSGDWNEPATWACDGNSVPDSTDVVTLYHNVIVSGTEAVLDLTIGDSSHADITLNIQSTGQLNIYGNLTANNGALFTTDSNGGEAVFHKSGAVWSDDGSAALYEFYKLSVAPGGALTINSTKDINILNQLDVQNDLTANSGTFVFATNRNQTINTNGVVTFYNFKKIGFSAGETLTITSGSNISASNLMTLKGAGTGQKLLLRSDVSGLQWQINAGSSPDINFVDVKDSYNNGSPIQVYDWIDSGNNFGWEQAYYTTTTTITASPASASTRFGEAISYSVHVASSGGTPTGTISIMENGLSFATSSLDGSGNATITVDKMPVGVHNALVAHYNGAGLFAASDSSPAATQTITKTDVSLTLSAPATAVYGEPVSLSASVTSVAPGSGVPIGQVTFKDGSTVLETIFLDESGQASMKAALSTGSHNITAEYAGTANANSGSDSSTVEITAPDLLLTFTQNVDFMDSSHQYPGDCVINSGIGTCLTLRDAIDHANAAAPGDKVTIEIPAINYGMNLPPQGLDDNSSGDFDLTHDVNFIGLDKNQSIISGNNSVGRIFHILGGLTINLSRVKLANGYGINGASAESGVPGGNGQAGGAVYNEGAGTLQATDVWFYGNAGGQGGTDSGQFGQNGGDGGSGGAIYNPSGGTVIIYGGLFESNYAGSGGGYYHQPLDAVTGGNGGAGGSGGGIYNAGSLTITGTAFKSNSSGGGGYGSDGSSTPGVGGPGGSGGAIYSITNIIIRRSNFEDNRGASGGYGGYVGEILTGAAGNSGNGAAIAVNNAMAYIFTSSFKLNMGPNVVQGASGGDGGALYASGNSSSGLEVRQCNFEQNNSGPGDNWSLDGWNGANGGAIAVMGGASLLVENSTFKGNYAGRGDAGTNGTVNRNGGYGGAIYLDTDGSNSISYSTLAMNQSGVKANSGADGLGGGIYFLNGSGNTGQLLLQNNVLFSNNVGWTDYNECDGDQITSGGYNYLYRSTGCHLSVNANDQLKNGEPLPILPINYYDDFGGPTLTYATPLNSSLYNKIPINTNNCGNLVKVDQRGMPRAQGGACEIGAYEFGGMTKLSLVSGNNQSKPINTGFAQLVVKATDELNGPLLNVNVTYTATTSAGGATINFSGGDATKQETSTDSASPYTAKGSGGANNKLGAYTATATSGAYSVIFNLANVTASTTTLAANPASSSKFGQTVDLTATVTSGATGNVTFQRGGLTISGCEAVAISGNTAQCSVSDTAYGSTSFTATYNGDSNYASSTSDSISYNVSTASTSVNISPNPASPITVGASVTFTATVSVTSPGGGIPTGKISFMDGASSISNCLNLDLDGSAQVTCTPNPKLTAGSHTIKAYYSPPNFTYNYNSSNSSITFEVNSTTPSTTTITSINPPAPKVGDLVTFNYTVTGSGGTPTGNVTIKNNTTTLCTGTVADGQCTYTFSAAGSASITANYAGDSNFSASASSPATSLTISVADTTTSLGVISPATPKVGELVTFNYSVTSGGGTPTGNVTIKNNTTTLCTGTVADGKCTYTFSAAGSASITANYAGDSNFSASASNPAASLTIDPANSTTTLGIISPATPKVGELVTFNYSVTSSGGTPTGNVTIKNNTTTLCTGTVADGKCTYTFSAAGSASITANYAGDSNFSASASNPAASLTIDPANTTTTLGIISPATPKVGELVTFNYSVTSGGGTPTGNVTIKNNTTTLCTGTVADGKCTYTFSAAGSASITANYAGDGNFASSASNPAASLTINPATTTTSLSNISPASPKVGDLITFSYTVTASGATPTGNVTIKDGTTPLCTASVATGSCTFTFNAAGDHSITANYAGTTNFSASDTSASPTTLTIAPAITNTLITNASPAHPKLNELVTFSFTVTSSAGTPSGTVTIKEGVNTLCSASVATGSCTYTFSTRGTHSISAFYSGSTNFAASDNTASPFSLSVGTSTTTTSMVEVLPTSPITGQVVYFTYTVTSSDGTPTGNVVVKDGSNILCTSTVAVGACNYTFTSVGTKNITVHYAGTTDFLASDTTSTPISLIIRPANTSTTITLSSSVMALVNVPFEVEAAVQSIPPGGGTPAGTILISDGVSSCTVTLPNKTCQLTFRTSGAKILTATYQNIDGNYLTSTITQAITVKIGLFVPIIIK
jgi:hypothetical protein